MKAYICHVAGGDWSVLAFAESAVEARKLSWREVVAEIDDEIEWTEWRVNRIWKRNTIISHLDKGVPQVILNPPTCRNCEAWGKELAPKRGFWFISKDNTYLCQDCAEGNPEYTQKEAFQDASV